MNQDKFSTMVKDGRDYIQIIQSVPKEKRFLLSMMADAFLNGMVAQERLVTERPSAQEGGQHGSRNHPVPVLRGAGFNQ